jgi:Zn-dependent M28 family amino/carboxypeptidase
VIAATARRITALALAATLAAACQSTAPTSPIETPGATTPSSTAPGGPSPASSIAPGSTAAGGAPLANVLRDAISTDDILADLQELQGIADARGGTRSAGSPGQDASAEFVAGELRKAGFEVELQPVDVPFFGQDAPSILQLADGSATFADTTDFKAMLFSASGNLTADVVTLGFNPDAAPGDTGGLGCSPGDWAGVPPGMIVLVQPAQCRRHDVVVNAQEAGAVAVVTSYASWETGSVLRPTLIEPDDIRIPVLGATKPVGLALAAAAGTGTDVHIETHTTVERRTSHNVIAETPGGDPAHVVMLGGHLDSVVDGPGINDDGSGSMAILEIARELATATGPAGAPWKVRVALWTGEEIGLVGSAAYVAGLDGPSKEAIAAYLNFDMIGSPNGVRLVYDGSGTSRPTESSAIARLFAVSFDSAGLPWQSADIGASSDHFPFDQAGIPIGGLFSGANERKTEAQASLFGGTANAADDACYHLACDTADNIDRELLEQMARAAAWVTGMLASGTAPLS